MPSVLITGASRGLGRELFEVYRQRGWTTFPLVRDFAAASGLKASSPELCHPILADVARDDIEARITAGLRNHAQGLDLLVNNAGHIKKLRGLSQTTADDLLDLFRVHCVGAFRCTRAALPFLKRAPQPTVVNITSRKGSINGVLAGKGTGIFSYQIAKAAQNMLSACLDHELKEAGVRVFAVHPGRLRTSIGPADADTPPREAAIRLADWVSSIDRSTVCGLHDVMGGGLLEW